MDCRRVASWGTELDLELSGWQMPESLLWVRIPYSPRCRFDSGPPNTETKQENQMPSFSIWANEEDYESIQRESGLKNRSISNYLVSCHLMVKAGTKATIKKHPQEPKPTKPDSQTAGYVNVVHNTDEIPPELTHEEKLSRLRDMTPVLGIANDLKSQPKKKDKK